MNTDTSNEDVFYVVIDDQLDLTTNQLEVVVESDTIEPQSNNAENLVSFHIETATTTTTATITDSHHINQNAITINDSTTISNDQYIHNEASIIQLQPANIGDKPTPRTYSKNNVVKSYAPTCGTTRIYQQTQAVTLSQASDQLNSNGAEIMQDSIGSNDELHDILQDKGSIVHTIPMTVTNQQAMDNAHSSNSNSFPVTSSDISEVRNIPHKKQKRKETLLTRPINEEDMELEFQVIEEPSHHIQEIEVKRKPRKEYRTKKKRLAMEKLSKEELDNASQEKEKDMDTDTDTEKGKGNEKKEEEEKMEMKKEIEIEKEVKAETEVEVEREREKEVKKEAEKNKEVKKEAEKHREKEKETQKQREKEKDKNKDKEKSIGLKKEHQQPQQSPQTERRTRLSNTCRVATGKMYKCNDCDFSTVRINNIILHMKESCPKLKKT